ncbi:MAG: ABC transporter substrate-binding protein, partial [Acidimicrobiales bacterium]
MKSWRAILALLIALGMFAAACGSSDDGDEASGDESTVEADNADADSGGDSGTSDETTDEDATPADSGEIKTGGVITYTAVGALRHLNGTVQSGLATAVPGTQVNASPLLLDENYEPQPYLAESWDISDDGLTVTLNLRDNAVFHDGVPITSEDVEFSIMTSK